MAGVGDNRRRGGHARLVAFGPESFQFRVTAHKYLIGSGSECDPSINEGTVAARHAILRRRFSTFRLTDLGSEGGTWVNGIRVIGTVKIEHGDEISFGAARFAFLNPLGEDPVARTRRGMSMRSVMEMLVLAALVAFGAWQYRANAALHKQLLVLQASASNGDSSPAATPQAISTTTAPVQPHPAADPGPAALGTPAPPTAATAPDLSAPPGAPTTGTAWLKQLNDYRAAVGLKAVTEDPLLSVGDAAHVRYLIENFSGLIKSGGLLGAMHSEDPSVPLYSKEGAAAAHSSDVAQWWDTASKEPPPDTWAVDHWMTGPAHRLNILNPYLKRVGYAAYCKANVCAAAMNVIADADPAPGAGAKLDDPIEFPDVGHPVSLTTLKREWPNPLTVCPGYSFPVGLPITIQIGAFTEARLNAFSLRRRSGSRQEPTAVCGIDARSYTNPDPNEQQLTRDVLRAYGAAVMIPREPLAAGATYDAVMTVNNKTYAWSFATLASK